MSVLSKLIARLRKPSAERRAAPRYATHIENRLFVHVYLLDPKIEQAHAARTLRLVGYTRDVSESGLGVILPGLRIAGRGIVGPDRRLRVVLGLPHGAVEMSATAVRHVDLEGGEPGYLVGLQILGMSRDDRALYLKFLRSLAVPDI